MKKKGLCGTCLNDESCVFPRKFPVLQCEEFTIYGLKPTKVQKARKLRRKSN